MKDKDLEIWVEWMALNPELAEKDDPELMEKVNEVIKKMAPYKLALFIEKLPDDFSKQKSKASQHLGVKRKKMIQDHINLISLFLNETKYFPEIEQKAIEKVRDEFVEQLEYWKDELKALTLQQKGKEKPELMKKQISFNSPETIEKLFNELKGFFPGKEPELLNALNGEEHTELLIFPHNGNKLIELFKRVKYNGFILNTISEIRDWICINFGFRYKHGAKIESRYFKSSTVWDILTKDKCEPQKKERICVPEWLPHKSYLQRQREAEREQL